MASCRACSASLSRAFFPQFRKTPVPESMPRDRLTNSSESSVKISQTEAPFCRNCALDVMDWESRAESDDILADILDLSLIFRGEEDAVDQVCDLTHLGLAHTPRRHCCGSEANAACDERGDRKSVV